MSMRRAASCCQPRQVRSVPRGARTGRARRRSQLAPHDREAGVGDGDREAQRLPERRPSRRSAGRRRGSGRGRPPRRRSHAPPGRRRRRPPRRAAWPSRRASGVVATQVMTAGSGMIGNCGYRSRSRWARGYADNGPNCTYVAGVSSTRSTLAYVPKMPRPRSSRANLRGTPLVRPRSMVRRRREGVVERLVVIVGQEGVDDGPVGGGRERVVGEGRSRSRRRGCLQPGRSGGPRAPLGVLPVVAGAVVETGVGARWDEPERGLVIDVDDADARHVPIVPRRPDADDEGGAHEVKEGT